MDKKNLYPYLILLPDEPNTQKKILNTIFGSEIAKELIKAIDSGVTFQKDLIEKLEFSNKTIINYLKKMVKLELLEEDSTVVEGYRRLFYRLTPMGEWFSSLVFYRKYEPEELKVKLEQLFQIYLKHAIGLLLENGFEQDELRDIFEYTLSSHLKEEYITKSTLEKYIGGIQSINDEIQSILSSIKSMDIEKKEDLLKIKDIKQLFMEFDEFYGILKAVIQKLNTKLKKY